MAEHENSEASEQEKLAEKADEDTTSYWSFGGWLSYAKEQSKKTYDMVRKDLVEFKTTVRTDTVSAITRTVDTVKQKVTNSNVDEANEAAQSGATKLIDDVSKMGLVSADDNVSAGVTTENDELKTLDHLELRIHELTRNAEAFLTVPKRTAEFEAWNATFSVDANTQQISDILIQYTAVRKFYNEFVPAKISHADFWRNLLFRIEQLRAEQATREQLKQRALAAATTSGSDTWEEDEEEPTTGPTNTSIEPVESHVKDSVAELDKHEDLQLEAASQGITTSSTTEQHSGINVVSVPEPEPEAEPEPVPEPEPTRVDQLKNINDAEVASQKLPEASAVSGTQGSRDGEAVKERATAKASNESQESYDDWEKWDE